MVTDGASSLYVQVARAMESLATGLQNGDVFPTERELQIRFDVSRTTIRQATNLLVTKGVLQVRRGKGVFVRKRITQSLGDLRSFTEVLKLQGYVPGSEILQFHTLTPNSAVLDRLGLPAGSEVLFIERVRLADGTPLNVSASYLPMTVARFFTREDLDAEQSLYRTIEEKTPHVIQWTEDEIESRLASRRVAPLLGIKEGAPVLHLRRVAYGSANLPVEYCESTCRGDKFHYVARTQRT